MDSHGLSNWLADQESALAHQTTASDTLSNLRNALPIFNPPNYAPSSSSPKKRPKSPIKSEQYLLTLDKSVKWHILTERPLAIQMETSECGTLFKSIKNAYSKNFLPLELRSLLNYDLYNGAKAEWYATEPAVGPKDEALDRVCTHPNFNSTFVWLITEYKTLSTVVQQTLHHNSMALVEASWNEKVHSTVLDLAISLNPTVDAYNITRANVMKEFRADKGGTPDPNGKLIDYAMVLMPEGEEAEDRWSQFREMMGNQPINQSTYLPLATMPANVFVVTTQNVKSPETRAQLGLWIASWFKRVSLYPSNENQRPAPVIPLLIVQGQLWEVWFAFPTDSYIHVYGSLKIGDTSDIVSAYRLLAVLCVLAQWMAKDYRSWFDSCLENAGV